jgi:methyl-accepting chemotaxis protein
MQAQAEGVQQISAAMTSLTATAQQSMLSVKELANTSDALGSAIGVLRESVARFRLESES